MPPSPSHSSNPWFAISMGLVGLIVGYGLAGVVSTGGSGLKLPGQVAGDPVVQQPAPSPPAAADVPPITASDHVRGNPEAFVTVIEYSDFECPFCKRHHPTMVQLLQEYGDKVNWVFRHFPLAFHPNALPGAVASECIAELGGNDAFWKFTDTVFEKQGEFDYASYAKDLGLDVSAFKKCTESGKFSQKIQDEMDAGATAGINGTPGNFIYNNKTKEAQLVSGAQPLSAFKSVIDGMLE